jgi:D-inositol-3-phosphate glycosyltransferase
VVATPVGGLPVAVAHERSGLLTSGGTPEQVAVAVHRIVTEPDLAARLARGGPAHAADYTWDRTVDGLLVAYRDSLAHRGKARVGLAR